MKTLLLSISLLSSVAFAEARKEFDEASEKKCHQELMNLGCVKADKESFVCAETHKAKLTKDCRAIHEARKTL